MLFNSRHKGKYNIIILQNNMMQKFAIAAIAVLSGVAQANYLSGEVRSQDWFLYGKFVARMQNPGKMGTV